jgi:hypothetical protein
VKFAPLPARAEAQVIFAAQSAASDGRGARLRRSEVLPAAKLSCFAVKFSLRESEIYRAERGK